MDFGMTAAADNIRRELKKRGITRDMYFPYGQVLDDGSIILAFEFKPRGYDNLVKAYPDGRVEFLREDTQPKLDMAALADENRCLKLQIENLILRKKLDRIQSEFVGSEQ